MRAIWNDTVIAESTETIVVESNLPPDSVRQARLRASAHRTTCPWKGVRVEP